MLVRAFLDWTQQDHQFKAPNLVSQGWRPKDRCNLAAMGELCMSAVYQPDKLNARTTPQLLGMIRNGYRLDQAICVL